MERSDEKALRIVEQQYNSFINLQDSWDFFRGLAEYTRTVREMTQTKPFIRALETQREMARKTYEMMNSKAMKELTQSANKLIPIAEKVIKQYDLIEDRISKMYDDRLDGRITDEMYDRKLKEYKERQSAILTEMHIHSDADEEFYLTANMVLRLAQRALQIFKSYEVHEKRQFLNFLLQNCQLEGKKPNVFNALSL